MAIEGEDSGPRRVVRRNLDLLATIIRSEGGRWPLSESQRALLNRASAEPLPIPDLMDGPADDAVGWRYNQTADRLQLGMGSIFILQHYLEALIYRENLNSMNLDADEFSIAWQQIQACDALMRIPTHELRKFNEKDKTVTFDDQARALDYVRSILSEKFMELARGLVTRPTVMKLLRDNGFESPALDGADSPVEAVEAVGRLDHLARYIEINRKCWMATADSSGDRKEYLNRIIPD